VTVFGTEASGVVVDANGSEEGINVRDPVIAFISGTSTYRSGIGAFGEYAAARARSLYRPQGAIKGYIACENPNGRSYDLSRCRVNGGLTYYSDVHLSIITRFQ
jgi:hypothetical protein